MKKFYLASLVSLTFFLGCASSTKKEVDKDIAEQHETTSAQSVDTGRKVIAESSRLTEDQKQKMLALMDRTQAEIASIKKEEGQIKASLFKYLAREELTESKISIYRSQLVKIDKKKMDLMFSSLEETQKILGKPGEDYPDLRELYRLNTQRY